MSTTSESSPIRVAVVGGGIAGLTLAIALTNSSTEKTMDIHLYEATPNFTETGAGIGMFRRPYQALKRLGLEKQIKALTNVSESESSLHLAFRMSKSDKPTTTKEYEMYIPFGNATLHRIEFQTTLAHHLEQKAITMHFGKKLLRYTSEDSGGVLLHFQDDTTASYDVLIGADGIHSATRRTMIQLAADEAKLAGNDALFQDLTRPGVKDPVYSGQVAYRNLISSEKLRKLNPNHGTLFSPMNYLGLNKHIIAFPVSHGKFVNFAGFVSHPGLEGTKWEGKVAEEQMHEDLVNAYLGWDEEVEQLVKCIEKPSMWAVNTMQALPIASHGPVAIIGDAAHAMVPHQGSGAGQAIEDAYVLGALLTHPSVTQASIPRVLKIYEKIRLPHGNDVQRLSRENGKLYEFAADDSHPELSLTGLSEEEMSSIDLNQIVKKIGETAVKNWEWAWTTDVETDKDEAIRMLEGREA